jgi:hypothetical protein
MQVTTMNVTSTSRGRVLGRVGFWVPLIRGAPNPPNLPLGHHPERPNPTQPPKGLELANRAGDPIAGEYDSRCPHCARTRSALAQSLPLPRSTHVETLRAVPRRRAIALAQQHAAFGDRVSSSSTSSNSRTSTTGRTTRAVTAPAGQPSSTTRPSRATSESERSTSASRRHSSTASATAAASTSTDPAIRSRSR